MSIKLDKVFKKFFDIRNKKFHRFNLEDNKKKDFNYNGFALWIGQDISNTDYKQETNNFKQQQFSLKSLFNQHNYYQNNLEYISNLEGDVYFTPNLYINKKYNEEVTRGGENVSFLQDIFVDIDGTYINKKEKALNELHKTLRTLNIPKPHLAIKTSQTANEGIKLHLHWLLDPLFIYDKENIKAKELEVWWKETANNLVKKLNDELDWNFDIKKSKDKTAFARIPLTTNQKTKDKVEILEFNDKERYSLQDKWVEKLNQYKSIQLNSQNTKNFNLDSIFNHWQIQKLLEGVSEGIRNDSQVAIALALKYDGLNKKKTLEIIREQNQKCNPPRKDNELKNMVNSLYRGNLGISAKKLAWIVEQATGNSVKTDFRIVKAINQEVNTKSYQKKEAYNTKEETYRKCIIAIKKMFLSNGVIFSKKDIAKKANVSYNTLKKKEYWDKIKRFIYKLAEQLNLSIVNNVHYNKFLILERINQLSAKEMRYINFNLLKRIKSNCKFQVYNINCITNCIAVLNFCFNSGNSPP